jgi:hypothetical protein
MKRLYSTITTRFAVVFLASVSFATLSFAHGGFDHVMGTVVKVESNKLTVKTAKGDVAVKLDEKTEYTKDDHKASAADLAPGLRVVVDLPEKVKSPAAHSIKIGAADATDSHSEHSEHAEHK